MAYTFSSTFADSIQSFLDQKKALGFKYDRERCILQNFDRFCITNFPSIDSLTDELCLAWATKRENECNNSFLVRIAPLREFARYLISKGDRAYIIPDIFGKPEAASPPYIYTEDEIYAIWDYLDHISPCSNSPFRHLTIPTMIKLLYCCGLRPCEARLLHVNDVDLNKGRLNIMDSKQRKSRIVMVADDVLEMLSEYNSAITTVLPDRIAFFPSSNGGFYERQCMKKPFRMAIQAAKITGSGGRFPRLYDFRHTFATHSLYRWMREGRDVSAMIPYLSSYMGHSLISDTYYYIHFVPGLFEELSGFDFSFAEKLLPEVNIDE